MAKTKKQLLQELLDLENSNVEDVEEPIEQKNNQPELINDTIDDKDKSNDITIQKAKKPRTQKQQEAFERAKAIRDANYAKRKEEKRLQEEEERKIIEEKLVKKAIAVKKKQIKKQAILDEVSDDETPIQKVKEIAVGKPKVAPTTPSSVPPPPTPKPNYPILKFF